MKRRAMTIGALLFPVLFTGLCEAAAPAVFGPARYEVRERYGKENIYRETVRTDGGAHVIRIQNGTKRSEMPDVLEMSVNGMALFGPEREGYPLFACFLSLGSETILGLDLRDHKPSGMRRPPVTPKFVIVSIERSATQLPDGLYGIDSWERLKALSGILRRLRDGEQRSGAIAALDLRRPIQDRTIAVRALGEGRDPRLKEFLLYLYQDRYASPAIRGAAGVSLGMLGDVAVIPALLDGLFQPVDPVRDSAARALSFYPEEVTRGPLMRRLERIDPLRTSALIRSVVGAGWKPYNAITDLAMSPDPHVAAVAIELLGSMRERKATDLLLSLLQRTEHPNRSDIIVALGASGDGRVLEPLLVIARDPDRRKGLEVPLGKAFARLGDRRAEPALQEMADTTTSVPVFLELRDSFRALTGRELRRKEN